MSSGSLANGLERVRWRFIESLRDGLPRITHLRMRATERDHIKESFLEIAQICHKIAGTAATLGFPELGANAARIDDFFRTNIDIQDDLDPHLLKEVDQLLAAIKAILSNHDPLSRY